MGYITPRQSSPSGGRIRRVICCPAAPLVERGMRRWVMGDRLSGRLGACGLTHSGHLAQTAATHLQPTGTREPERDRFNTGTLTAVSQTEGLSSSKDVGGDANGM
ncbi:hypothetical protein AAFF_G00036500 [Aldrovandia affinis]|uniref:Uncharacterized protein n=1 Tax=Aldrovandia affinis TaxID=143900 RepID=A0AAD7S3B9_9TELE|nr:hypothetical protein AAFF_G00036500 [Aldrovandia affinis]